MSGNQVLLNGLSTNLRARGFQILDAEARPVTPPDTPMVSPERSQKQTMEAARRIVASGGPYAVDIDQTTHEKNLILRI